MQIIKTGKKKMNKKKRKLNLLEIRVGRSEEYWEKHPEVQWNEDAGLGILDWDGTEEWLDKHGK